MIRHAVSKVVDLLTEWVEWSSVTHMKFVHCSPNSLPSHCCTRSLCFISFYYEETLYSFILRPTLNKHKYCTHSEFNFVCVCVCAQLRLQCWLRISSVQHYLLPVSQAFRLSSPLAKAQLRCHFKHFLSPASLLSRWSQWKVLFKLFVLLCFIFFVAFALKNRKWAIAHSKTEIFTF